MAHRSMEGHDQQDGDDGTSGGGGGRGEQQRISPLQSTAAVSLTSSSTRLHNSMYSSPLQQQQYPSASPATSGLRTGVARSSPIAIVPSNNNNTEATSLQNRNHHRQQADLASSDDHDDENNNNDDDDDDSVVDVEMDAIKLRGGGSIRAGGDLNNNTSRSLPSRLLRAPRLGSIPTRGDADSYWMDLPETILPPPMALADSTTQAASSFSARAPPPPPTSSSSFLPQTATSYGYGSLRESHLRGRFLDGPQSYRDSTTGDLRRIQYRVRFQEQASSNSTAAATFTAHSTTFCNNNNNLSIGERMRQATAERQRKSSGGIEAKKNDSSSSNALVDEKAPPTSRLAAMFDDRDPQQQQSQPGNAVSTSSRASIVDIDKLEIIPAAAVVAAATAAQEYGWQNDVDMGGHNIRDNDHDSGVANLFGSQMLSISFTGLELLQRGLRLATIMDTTTNFDSPEFLPRDAQGNNAMLARSFSDPGAARRPRVGTGGGTGRGTLSSSTTPSPSIGATSNTTSAAADAFPPFNASPFLLPPGVYNNTLTNVNNNNASSTMVLPPPMSLDQTNATSTVYQASFISSPTTTATSTDMMMRMMNHHQNGGGEEEDENPDVEGAFDMDME